jgi:hypothetical protein
MIRAMALVCDVPGCKSRILGTVSPRSYRAKWLRRKALEQGWTRTERRGDLCPDHTIARPMESETPSSPGPGPPWRGT